MSTILNSPPSNQDEQEIKTSQQLIDLGKSKRTKLEGLRENLFPIIFSTAFLVLTALFFIYIAQSYNWQFDKVFPHIISYSESGIVFGVLLKSLVVTFELIAVSLVFALGIGVLLATMNLSASPVAHLLAKGFIGIVRNTPLLMQLYLVYFVFAPVFSLSPFLAACVALACFEGAYMAEIFRAGFKSVPFTQWEAGFSLGFSTMQAGRIIVLPQAISNILPSLTGQMVSLIKDTSLVSAISVADLTLRATELISETYLSFEIWLIVALFYLVLTSFVSVPLGYYAKYAKKKKGILH